MLERQIEKNLGILLVGIADELGLGWTSTQVGTMIKIKKNPQIHLNYI